MMLQNFVFTCHFSVVVHCSIQHQGQFTIDIHVIWFIVMIGSIYLMILECCCIVHRVMTAVPLSTVVLQYADLAVVVAAVDVIVIPEMIAVDHVPLAVATDTVTTGADGAVTDTHGGTEAATDIVLLAGHRQKQRASRTS